MNRLARTHRRLAALMGLAGLLAFSGGAGFEPIAATLTAAALIVALFWHPSPALSARLEKLWGPLALLLVIRALVHVFVLGGDVVVPVVDLLLLLLAAESLRSLDARNDARIYALAFALLLAATAYRPGLLFALAFVVFVAASCFALPLGLLRRHAERFGLRDPGIDRALAATATRLTVATLGVAVLVFLAFPRGSRGWTGRGETAARSVAGFADEISLGEHGARIQTNPEIVLRVEFPEGPPDNLLSLHWRGRSYDRFDGIRWTRSEGIRPSTAPLEWYRERWGGGTITQHVYAERLDVRILFALHPIIDVETDAPIQPMFDNVGDFFYWGATAPVYTARSAASPPPADSLRRANSGFMPDRTRFLQLPTLPDRIAALADSLTRTADNRYDKAVAIEHWLRTEFSYTRELPPTAADATLDHFLFERRAGHCEYFSTAMVVLLRSVGIHARNVNGFLGGRWNEFGRYLAVTQNEAHSWVEVWFPGYGWVEFDPTPGGSTGRAADAEWLWPGRILLDGLHHRWGKWVLDYSVDDQVGLMDRLGGLLESTPSDEDRPDPGSEFPTWLRVLLLLGVIGAGAGAIKWRWGTRREGSPEGVVYLRLVRAARRAGIVQTPAVTPARLVARLRSAVPEAAGPAARLVELYQRARFAGRPLSTDERRDLRTALAAVHRALR